MAFSPEFAESTQTETVSEKVVSAVAEETNTDPLSLDPLYTEIDPDVLDALFEGDGEGFDHSPDRVEFTYSGCEVVVTADGNVRVSSSGQEYTEEAEWR